MTIARLLAPQPDHQGALDWAAIESGPSILPDHVQVEGASVAAFSADEWPLAALPGSGRDRTLIWHNRGAEALARRRKGPVSTWPEALLPSFKRLAWLMLNKPTPDLLLHAAHAKRRTYPAAGSIQAAMYMGRDFAAWLDSEHITSLDAVTTDLLDLYRSGLLNGRMKERSASKYLTFLIDLWGRASLLPEVDRIEEPSWHDNGRLLTSGAQRGESENATLIVSPSTMDPLLAWVIAMLDLSIDLIPAAEEYRQLLADPSTKGDEWRRQRADEAANSLARQIVRTHYPPGTPLPGASDWATRGKMDFAPAYIAAVHGGGRVKRAHIRWAVYEERPDWQENLDYTIPLPMSITPQGRIADMAWRERLDYREVPTLIAHLRTACLLAATYLSGMRGREARELKTACGVAIPAENGGADYLITGRIWKNVLDEHGRQDVNGREHTWRTIKPGYDATLVAERIRTVTKWSGDEQGFLFRGVREQAVSDTSASEWIADFIAWANQQVDELGLPDELRIPECVGGPIRLTRLRRTLAWHIRHRPMGHVALAIQYGHMDPEQGEGYSGRKAAGLKDVLDEETRSAVASTTLAMRDEIAAGGGVSGLGAERALNIARRTMGVLTARDEKNLLKDKDRAVFDNPKAFALCLNNPDKMACRIGKPKGPPRLLDCVGPRCANLVRTDSTVAQMADEVGRLRSEATFAPPPLADRLESSARDYEEEVDAHNRSRRTLSAGLNGGEGA